MSSSDQSKASRGKLERSVRVYLTDEEKAWIEAKRGDASQSSFVQRLVQKAMESDPLGLAELYAFLQSGLEDGKYGGSRAFVEALGEFLASEKDAPSDPERSE